MAENKYFNSFTDTTTGEKIHVEDEETKEKAESLEQQVTELNETLTELNVPMLKLNGSDGGNIAEGNLNDYKDCGTYRINNNTIAAAVENTPADYGGIVWVIQPTNSNAYCIQIYLTYNLAIYARRYVRTSDTWYDWQQIL